MPKPHTTSRRLPARAAKPAGTDTRAETLTGQAYQKLRHALMTGALLPEQVLTVRGVAEEFGVSLTPVREAVQRLVVEQGLEVVNGRILRVPRLGIETYREILKIRMELESLAAKEAAPRISNEEIDRLDAVMQSHLAAIQAGDAHQTLVKNTDFHLSIYRASGQPILVRIIEGLWLRVGPTLNLLFPQYCGSLTGHETHLVAVDALRRRDGDALGQAMRDDLTHGSRYLIRLLKP
ncbi:GntR family transcriptional regulator [Variovorax sp. PBL-H6]|uniref:GntR family transcriptional regulator n=1 Tax=Variovorax sp. PBL-H6 TaxID=434009 RepID=UPI0013A53EA8|nr:GntR family transcriptional regulator [Variovorax sp. PBL-H6]